MEESRRNDQINENVRIEWTEESVSQRLRVSLHTRKIQFKGTEKLMLFFGVDKESARRKRHFTCMVGLKIVVVEGLSLLRVNILL